MNIEVQGAYSISLNVILGEDFVQGCLIQKLSLHESFIVKSVSNRRQALVTLLEKQINEAGIVDICEHIKILSFMQLDRVLVVEGKEHNFLMVDSHRHMLRL